MRQSFISLIRYEIIKKESIIKKGQKTKERGSTGGKSQSVVRVTVFVILVSYVTSTILSEKV